MKDYKPVIVAANGEIRVRGVNSEREAKYYLFIITYGIGTNNIDRNTQNYPQYDKQPLGEN